MRGFWAMREGTPQEAAVYAKKDGYFFEEGTMKS